MMRAAIVEVKAAQAQIATYQQEETERVADPDAESQWRAETMKDQVKPTVRAQQLQLQYPAEYKRMQRAVARAITEEDEVTRRKLYDLLHCAPEEEP